LDASLKHAGLQPFEAFSRSSSIAAFRFPWLRTACQRQGKKSMARVLCRSFEGPVDKPEKI
jgi:hypothetical protein